MRALTTQDAYAGEGMVPRTAAFSLCRPTSTYSTAYQTQETPPRHLRGHWPDNNGPLVAAELRYMTHAPPRALAGLS
jgi:hypothetical protein